MEPIRPEFADKGTIYPLPGQWSYSERVVEIYPPGLDRFVSAILNQGLCLWLDCCRLIYATGVAQSTFCVQTFETKQGRAVH